MVGAGRSYNKSYGAEKFFVQVVSAVVGKGELGEAKCDFIKHADCR